MSAILSIIKKISQYSVPPPSLEEDIATLNGAVRGLLAGSFEEYNKAYSSCLPIINENQTLCTAVFLSMLREKIPEIRDRKEVSHDERSSSGLDALLANPAEASALLIDCMSRMSASRVDILDPNCDNLPDVSREEYRILITFLSLFLGFPEQSDDRETWDVALRALNLARKGAMSQNERDTVYLTAYSLIELFHSRGEDQFARNIAEAAIRAAMYDGLIHYGMIIRFTLCAQQERLSEAIFQALFASQSIVDAQETPASFRNLFLLALAKVLRTLGWKDDAIFLAKSVRDGASPEDAAKAELMILNTMLLDSDPETISELTAVQ